jgi:protein-disulfide isomerase
VSVNLDQPRLAVPISARDHVLGPELARVTLVEYGDYECPYCREANGVLKLVLRVVGDQMRFAYRHFPLTQIHSHAHQAAEAAEAAAAQGHFWEMHHLLFEHQDRLGVRDLLRYAAGLELDVARVANELAERTHAPRVREDSASGIRSGVNGTPTLFINGVRHNGGYDLTSLLEALGPHL